MSLGGHEEAGFHPLPSPNLWELYPHLEAARLALEAVSPCRFRCKEQGLEHVPLEQGSLMVKKTDFGVTWSGV